MDKIRGGARYYGLLFAVCAVTFAVLVSVHVLTGRSLLWNPDGLALYYTFFVYEGEWLRGILSSIAQGHPEIPMFSFDMGYGADILATMGGCLNDPFNLVSALCPPRVAEYVLEALIFARFFLAAVTFSWYSLERGRSRAATFCGALCYILCGFVLYWGVFRHPNFINLAILLPFILQGADRVLAGKSPFRLIGGFFLLLLFSLYFSYMVLIVTMVYCLLSFFLGYSERSARAFFGLLGRFALYILLAALLAGVVVVPMFLVLTSMGRVDLVREIPTWESFQFYWEYGSNLIGGLVGTRSLVLGAVPVLGSLAFLAARKLIDPHTWRPWALGLLLCVAGSMIPWVGSAMNGFGYVSDRWLLVLGFCAANATVLVVPMVRRFGRRQWVAFSIGALVVLVWAVAYAVDARTQLSIMALGAFAIALGILVATSRFAPRVTAGAMAVCVVASSSMSALMFNSPLDRDYAELFAKSGNAKGVSSTVPYDRIQDEIDPAYRIDRGHIYGMRNQALLAKVKGIDFFSSFYNQNVDDARYDLGISSHWSNYIYNGVEERFALENLMGAKGYIAERAPVNDKGESEEGRRSDEAPYGYEPVQNLGESHGRGPFEFYESSLSLPIAFTYDTAVPYSDFLKLGMVQRQELLTQSCVLEDDAIAADKDVHLQISTEEIPCEVAKTAGLNVVEGGVQVYEPNAKLTLKVACTPESENYVVFDHLSFDPMSLKDQRLISGHGVTVPETGESASRWDELKWTRPTKAEIAMRAGDHKRELRIATEESSAYGGKVNWAVNMGYSEAGVEKITLRFKTPGTYTWSKLNVVSQPVAAISENLKALKEANKASVNFGANRMDIAVAPEEGRDVRYVFVSVPFSAGWSATVDGRSVDILKANTGFMAVPLDGAAHDLVLSYTTPGLTFGAACTAAGVLGLAALVLVRREQKKRQEATA